MGEAEDRQKKKCGVGGGWGEGTPAIKISIPPTAPPSLSPFLACYAGYLIVRSPENRSILEHEPHVI